MVYLCASIAAAAPAVAAEIVDAATFPDLAARFKVGVVPKVLINDSVEVQDVVPAAELIARIVAAGAAGVAAGQDSGMPSPGEGS